MVRSRIKVEAGILEEGGGCLSTAERYKLQRLLLVFPPGKLRNKTFFFIDNNSTLSDSPKPSGKSMYLHLSEIFFLIFT